MRIALFGSGWIMDFHARGVLEHPGGELVAAANWREASLRSLAERHGIPRITTDWRELVADPEVDAVIIGTPNALHAPQAIACLEAGKHVLVEKPMARTLAEAEAMNAAAAASGRRLMVAHCWRFHDDVRALRARIAGGELGEITKTRGYGVHAGWGPSGWFTDLELAGGGALLDMGVHAIDTVRFLLGDPALESVCARIATRYGDYAVDDDGLLLIAMGERHQLAGRVGMVAPSSRRPGGRYRGVWHGRVRTHMGFHGGPRGLRALRAADVQRPGCGVHRRALGGPAAASQR